MVRYVMTLIISVGSVMIWMMTLNLYMMPLNKIIEINYTYGSLKNQWHKDLVEDNNIFYFSENG